MLSDFQRDDRTTLLARLTTRRAISRIALGGGAATASFRAATTLAQTGTPEASNEICTEPSTGESLAVGEAYFEAFNAGDVDALGALLADDYVHQGALVAEQDRDIHQERLQSLHASFPDLHYEIEDIVAEGDLVAIRHTFTGTNDGEFQGQAPTGNQVVVGGMHIHRVACGEIVETWNTGDAYGLLQQVGIIPGGGFAPAGTPTADAAASAVAGCAPGTPEEDHAVVARWFAEAVNPGQIELLDEFVAPDAVLHATGFPDALGVEAIRGLLAGLSTGFSDLQFEVMAGPAQDGLVVEHWTATGTHDGEFQGVAPTGTMMSWPGINFYRVDCGQIVEIWTEADTLGRARQLGLVP